MDSFALLRLIKLLLSVTLLCAIANAAQAEFNVMDYGAKADGVIDDSLAFLKAWKDTCNTETGEPTMIIPSSRRFFVRPITFAGPCKSEVKFLLNGVICAPKGPQEWKQFNDAAKLIEFENVTGLNISGGGLIDGRGRGWWDISCRYHPKLKDCGRGAPTVLRFHKSDDVRVSNLTINDSPQTHILLLGCNNIDLEYLNIRSPDGSPNTDGIHIQATNHVSIHDSNIGVGDDCVSIGDGISNLSVTYVSCGPGHGVSIGSLGKDGNVVNVSNIHVRHVNFTGTQNGGRIKTYPNGKGKVRDIEFSNIYFTDVGNPIMIDQYYFCSSGCAPTNVGVQITDVRYSKIYGTSKSEMAVNFNCSANVPCTKIELEDIRLASSSSSGNRVSASCNNAFGEAKGIIQPKSCLKP